MLLSTLTATLLSATVTNTETVHDLAAYNDHVVACTEGGLELFTGAGRPVRTLTVEDGLPSHFCRALEVAGDRLFAATDEGVVAVDKGWRVEPVVEAKWHALPPVGGMNAELYRAALGWLLERLPSGPTYTAFTEGYLGTADGRVMAPGAGRMWTVPGPVRMLEEVGGSLRVGTTEGAFTLGPDGLASLPVPVGPLAYSKGPKGETRVLGGEGEARRWGESSGEARALPTGATSTLEVNGVAWAGTRGQGVFRRQGGEWKRVTPTGQLCGNHITALARHQGQRVVGTFDKGVCWELPDGRWRTFRAPHLPSNHVLGLASDGRNLYVATMYGLGLYDGKTWTPMAYGGRNPVALGKLSVLAAVADTEDGVALVDGRGTSFVKRASQPLELAKRLQLPEGWSTHVSGAHGAGSYLWVASEDRGLVRWDGARWTRFHDGKDLTDNWVTALSADAEGRAVVGTCQDGFSYFDGSHWTRVRDAGGLPSRYVVSVALVPGGALVGTLLGAAHYDAMSGTVRPLPRLADPRVHSILVEEGTVLFGTEGGLSQLDWSAPAAVTRR
ncbi:hypothetical protein [Archangium sp.]|uniref:ligand-binding sensor domain-containing protein n=1 Tax=Archangium sp. TaxID=1872627 RepID=UPI002D2F82BC|nr:hypothetical protein [Archangium sp.]HYO53570.1 hypothetical protein [Archangium sp.]